MDSFFARNRLSAYLDGSLPDAEATAVADAIEQDPELKAEYDALHRAVELLRREGPAEAPRGFHARVMEQLPNDRWHPRLVVQIRRLFSQIPLEAGALAAAALVVVIVIGRKPMTHEVPETDLSVAALDQTEAKAPPVVAQAPKADTEERTADPSPQVETAAASSTPPPAPETTPAKKAPSTSAPKAKETYQAEWEKSTQAGVEPTTQNDSATNKPYGYRVTLSDQKILFDLSVISEKWGGQLLDSAGRRLKPYDLTTENNYAQVQLLVPSSRANAVHGKLRALGGVAIPAPASTPLYGPENVGFVVEVSYLP